MRNDPFPSLNTFENQNPNPRYPQFLLRYDESCSGEVDYSEFVQKVMESDFKGVSSTSQKALSTLVSSTFLHQTDGQCLEGEDDS